MNKLLIVDDEPLVQVGIKSMLNWSELNIEVIGSAVNGKAALEMIEKFRPEIVITDIKMPVMDGLELLRIADERYGSERPVFIMLTSYEDFKLAQEAIKYRAFDYLIKLELTPESLRSTMEKAIAYIEETNAKSGTPASPELGLHIYKEKFMISLLNSLFESEEQMRLEAENLKLDFSAASYLCCYGSFEHEGGFDVPSEKTMNLFHGSLQMLRELSEKYCRSQVISLDLSHFALILNSDRASAAFDDGDYAAVLDMLKRISASLSNYYNVSLKVGVGFAVSNPILISESYQYARLSYRQTDETQNIKYLIPDRTLPHDAFHFSLFQKDLTRAFEEYNSKLLTDTVHSLTELLSAHPHHYVQALDAASNLLYLSISLLPDGESVLSEMFSDSNEGYMSLYRHATVDQIVSWLEYFSSSLAALFDEKKRDYKNRIVTEVRAYIQEHVCEKLTLNEVAAVFGISPSYLSQLFGKYSDTGFSEYINVCKIEKAKQLLKEENSKIYEVADALSFGSEFYFSKVFKKMEGISPSEYINGGY